MTDHHDVFSRFDLAPAGTPPDMLEDWSGALFKAEWNGQAGHGGLPVVPPLPFFGEEYFEWIDCLEAAEQAAGTFTFVELGAGWGRWALRAARAAISRGVKTHLVLVEAEPKHAEWARAALKLNADPLLSGVVIERAIAYDAETVPLAISAEKHGFNAGNWYGQAVVHEMHATVTEELYHERPVILGGSGYGYIEVPTTTLEDVLAPYPFVDMVDMDLQGIELQLLQQSMPILNERVRRVHIGTHSREIEETARANFTAAGWTNIWDFASTAENDTPYGRHSFVDGISAWLNPRFS